MSFSWITPARLRRAPLSSRWFGPPRHDAPVASYPGGKHIDILASVEFPIRGGAPDACFGEVPEAFAQSRVAAKHRVDVFSIREGRVLGPDAHIVAPGDYLLHDTLWCRAGFRPGLHGSSTLHRRRRYPCRHLPGRTFLIGSDWSCGGYGHFLTDALGRWMAFLRATGGIHSLDRVLVSSPGTAATARALSAAVAQLEIVHADPGMDYHCEQLVATSFPHPVPEFSHPVLEDIRALLPPRPPRRLVYLSRRGFTRHPANADELERILADRGFETISPDDHLGAIDACREARVVVGAEGANLFNTLFTPPGASVVVLLGPSISVPYLPALGRALEHSTTVIAAAPASDAARPRFSPEHLAAALDRALG